jgi:hypothetical protein
MSVNLTSKVKTTDNEVRRLATYEFWSGKDKKMVKHNLTLVGYGKSGEALQKAKTGEVVAEGRLNLSEPTDNQKDARLELILNRIHF